VTKQWVVASLTLFRRSVNYCLLPSLEYVFLRPQILAGPTFLPSPKHSSGLHQQILSLPDRAQGGGPPPRWLSLLGLHQVHSDIFLLPPRSVSTLSLTNSSESSTPFVRPRFFSGTLMLIRRRKLPP